MKITLPHLPVGFLSVIPAEAGIQKPWIPVFTGMTALGAQGEVLIGIILGKEPGHGNCLKELTPPDMASKIRTFENPISRDVEHRVPRSVSAGPRL
jgi:hypothetical protein